MSFALRLLFGSRFSLRALYATLCVISLVSAVAETHAQTAVVVGPPGDTIRTVTPRFTVRAQGFGASRPFSIVLQVGTQSDFANDLIVDTSLVSTSTDTDIQIVKLLPSSASLYWRAIVSTADGKSAVSVVTGPRPTLPWLTLLSPNFPAGDQLDTRRPAFVWRSPSIIPSVGDWRYEFEITSSDGEVEMQASMRADTVFIPQTDLEANTSYRWSVRATAPDGQFVHVSSNASFLIEDPALPTSTLLYQNFPNPFPSHVAFATCFWFDVGGTGAKISMDILDLRGNLVRTIIPGADRVEDFIPGRYGRGIAGVGSNCDNRFVWNGTAADGRPVAAGVYLLRFIANNGRPEYRRIIFKGR